MPNWYGGVSLVEFGPGPDFDFATGSPTLTMDRSNLLSEGNQLPVPEPLTEELADGQQGPTGEDVPFEIRGKNLDTAEVDTLRTAGYEGTLYDVRFTSLDGNTTMTLKDIILQVVPSPIVERGAYGFVLIRGRATSAGPTAQYSYATTP